MKLIIFSRHAGFDNVNGKPYPIELFLSSDMKGGVVLTSLRSNLMHVLSFMLLILGLNGVDSNGYR